MHRPLVLLANLGTPAAPTPAAVRAFLAEFLADPLVVDWPRWLWLPVLHGIVLRTRPAKSAKLYSEIWGRTGSPLAAATARMAQALQAELADAADVRAAYRYGEPSLAAEIEGAARERQAAVVLPLFPQRTGSSSGTIERLTQSLAQRLGCTDGVRCALLPFDEPGYIEALTLRTEAALHASAADFLLVSYHGIPERHDRREGGLYRADCARTTAALLRRLDWSPARASMSFQSRFGPGRWLGPSTAEVLALLPKKNVRRLAVIAPGFLTEGLETLEELDLRGRKTFLRAGGEAFVRAGACEDHPALIAALARLVRSVLAQGVGTGGGTAD